MKAGYALMAFASSACAHRPLVCPFDLQRIEREGRAGNREEFCARPAALEAGTEATPSGWFRENYANGQRRCEGVMREGRKEGVWRCFHPNGVPMARLEFKNGARNGFSIERAPDGSIESRISWRNGLFDGELLTYRKDGSIEHRQAYRRGKRDGLSRSYDQNGALIYEGRFKDGHSEGCARERASASAPWEEFCATPPGSPPKAQAPGQ